jgi:integrase
MTKDWRIADYDRSRSEDRDPLIRRSIVERNPGTEQVFMDKSVKGFGLKITAKNYESFIFQKRVPGHKNPKRWTLEARTVAAARAQAAKLVSAHYLEVAERPPANPETLREVVDAYLAFRGQDYKSRRAFERSMNTHVLPVLGERQYESITRQDLARLRDDIIAKGRADPRAGGRHAAHRALQNLSAVWTKFQIDHASDGFRWPKVRSPLAEAVPRPERKLSDLEIRQIWHATSKLAPNKRDYYRFLFLTGLRRSAAARITREQVGPDWSTVTTPDGGKTKPKYTIPLSGPARDLLREHFPEGAQWAFACLGPFEALKRELDSHIPQIAPWINHDLRDTCRTLLSRAGVNSDLAERCLGHTKQGVRKRYDHYDFVPEMKGAFEELAKLIADITK